MKAVGPRRRSSLARSLRTQPSSADVRWARQVHDVLQQLMRPFHWLVAGLLIGGEKKKSEKARIRKGLSVVVGTVGRLADHMSSTEA